MSGGGPLVPEILYLCLALVAGCAARMIVKNWIHLPYTVILFFFGMLFACIDQASPYAWHDTVDIWKNMDPHTILLVFLPALIFESAFSVDYHIFRHGFWQFFTLAGPGMVLSCVLTALLPIWWWDWDWDSALMFGAMMSATDPVAVVALLKELGASKQLAVLIEGESLLNDGTAMVVFIVFKDRFLGDDLLAGDITGTFFRLAGGGTLLGIIFGLVTIFLLSRVYDDAMVEITLTIMSAYLCFWTAEGLNGVEELNFSGILATVTLGVIMSGHGKTRISPQVEHTLHSFWEILEYFANTVIFVLAGTVVANTFFDDQVDPWDWALLIALYVFLHVIRGITVLVCTPILRAIGYGMSWREAVVITYAGLRGAIGIALGLLASAELQEKHIEYQELQHLDTLDSTQQSTLDDLTLNLASIESSATIGRRSLFMVSGIAALTLIVNGSTTGMLLRYLRLTKPSLAKQKVFRHAIKDIFIFFDKMMENLKLESSVQGANWDVVREFTTDALGKEFRMQENKTCKDLRKSAFFGERAVTSDQLLVESRRRFLNTLRSCYWHQFEHGMIPGNALEILVDSIGQIHDHHDEDLRMWDTFEAYLHIPTILKRIVEWPKPFSTLARTVVRHRLELGYQVASAYVHGLDRTCRILLPHMTEKEGKYILKEETEDEMDHAFRQIGFLQASFPEVIRSIKTRLAAKRALDASFKFVKGLHTDGEIDDQEHERLDSAIQKMEKRLVFHPPAIEIPEKKELLESVPCFRTVSKVDMKDYVIPHAHDHFFEPGETLAKEGEPCEHLIIITRGVCRVSVYDQAMEKYDDDADTVIQYMSQGSVIGELELMSGQAWRTTVKAESVVEAFFIKGKYFPRLIEHYFDLEEKLWQMSGPMIAKTILPSKFHDIPMNRLKRLFASSSLSAPVKEGAKRCLMRQAVLLKGEVLKTKFNSTAKPLELGILGAHFDGEALSKRDEMRRQRLESQLSSEYFSEGEETDDEHLKYEETDPFYAMDVLQPGDYVLLDDARLLVFEHEINYYEKSTADLDQELAEEEVEEDHRRQSYMTQRSNHTSKSTGSGFIRRGSIDLSDSDSYTDSSEEENDLTQAFRSPILRLKPKSTFDRYEKSQAHREDYAQ